MTDRVSGGKHTTPLLSVESAGRSIEPDRGEATVRRRGWTPPVVTDREALPHWRVSQGRAPVLKVHLPDPLRGGSRVVVAVRQLQVTEGQIRLRADLSAIDYAAYLMDEAGAPGDKKGHSGVEPALFTGGGLMPPPQWFMRQWEVSAARARGRTALTAWCINILRADLPDEGRVFSLAVSFRPQDALYRDGSERFSMKRFTQRLMEQVREDHFGAPFLWTGAAHYNTKNPHVHIIIRGVLDVEDGNDKSGMPCRIHQAYWRKGIRSRAIELLERVHSEEHERRAG